MMRLLLFSTLITGLASACLLSAQETPAPATTADAPATPASAGTQAAGGSVPAASAPPATQSTVPAATPQKSTVPLPDRPYRINVQIGFKGNLSGIPSARKAIVRSVQDGLHRMYGAMWNAVVEESTWLPSADEWRLTRLETAEVATRYPEESADKVLTVAVHDTGSGLVISCREYDTRVVEFSPVVTEQVETVRLAGDAICRLCRDAFRPILMFANPSVDKTELEFLLQGGNLIPPDPTAAQIQDGDVLRTFFRQMDRKNPGKVKLLQRLDLCYVRVTSFNRPLSPEPLSAEDASVTVEGAASTPALGTVDTAHVRGVLLAHGAVPFGGKSRSLEQIALRQRPSQPTSRVRLVLQNRTDRPLICTRVDVVAKLKQTDTNDVAPVRFLTDRNGELVLAVDSANPTYWLYVYSGSILLARVPYAPGLLPSETLKLPDDSIRLGVEGDLYLLRDELVDMVAEKAVYLSIARKTSEAKDAAAFQNAVTLLNGLPGKDAFNLKLNEVRAPALRKAENMKNAGAVRRIEKLCTAMSESLTVFFASEKRVKESEEISKLRAAAGIAPQ